MTSQDQTTTRSEDRPTESVVAAAIARSLVKPMAFLYSRPIKIFRPSAVDSLFLVRTRASTRGIGSEANNPVHRIYLILKDTVRKDGFIGLVNQVIPSIAVNSFLGVITFGTYALWIDAIQERKGSSDLSFGDYFQAGCIGGFAQSIFSCPLDNAKVRLQMQIEMYHHHYGLFHALVDQHRSPQGLYKSFFLSSIRESLGMALFFGTYDTSRMYLHSKFDDMNLRYSRTASVAIAGGVAGVSYQFVSHPVDVIMFEMNQRALELKSASSSMIMTGSAGGGGPNLAASSREVVREIVREQGLVRGLFKGLPTSLLKAFSPSAVGFLVYDMLLREEDIENE